MSSMSKSRTLAQQIYRKKRNDGHSRAIYYSILYGHSRASYLLFDSIFDMYTILHRAVSTTRAAMRKQSDILKVVKLNLFYSKKKHFYYVHRYIFLKECLELTKLFTFTYICTPSSVFIYDLSRINVS